MRVVDLSRTLEMGMPEPAAVPRFSNWWYARQAWGDRAEFQVMLISEHTGTNVDAPRHLFHDGAAVDELPVDAYFGPGQLLDLRSLRPRQEIRSDDLESALAQCRAPIAKGDVILLLTGHDDRFWQPTPASYAQLRDRPALGIEAAQILADRGIKAVGVDTVSPDPSGAELEVHKYLLGRDVLIIEGLTNLETLVGMRFTFAAFPLKISGGSGSPVRAVALLDDRDVSQ